jgi:sterol desaturase/sphingolipid hydroxylase (fatty acid hydroxylase superfamily)
MGKYILWVTLGALVVLAIEIAAGRHKGAYQRGDMPVLIGSVLARIFLAPLAALLVAPVYAALLPHYKNALAGAPFWLAFPGVLLFAEFVFYWVHRWAHSTTNSRFPLLWMVHRTHHSGAHMNTSTYLRLHPLWYVIIPNAWTVGLALYLGLTDAGAATIVLIAIWNVVTHCAFRWDDPIRRSRAFGPAFRALEHVIVSPGIHHTHHGFGRDGASYKNFGVMLSLFDWMFGTLHIPEGRPSRYGLPGHEIDWAEELFYPLVRRRS